MNDNAVIPGAEKYSPAIKIGSLLTEEFKKDPHFYFFSPGSALSYARYTQYKVDLFGNY